MTEKGDWSGANSKVSIDRDNNLSSELVFCCIGPFLPVPLLKVLLEEHQRKAVASVLVMLFVAVAFQGQILVAMASR